jgi:hypothetical protein
MKFLFFIGSSIAESPVTLLVCPRSSLLIFLPWGHVEFSAGEEGWWQVREGF